MCWKLIILECWRRRILRSIDIGFSFCRLKNRIFCTQFMLRLVSLRELQAGPRRWKQHRWIEKRMGFNLRYSILPYYQNHARYSPRLNNFGYHQVHNSQASPSTTLLSALPPISWRSLVHGQTWRTSASLTADSENVSPWTIYWQMSWFIGLRGRPRHPWDCTRKAWPMRDCKRWARCRLQ